MTQRKGFTLIEVLISTAIFAVIMVSLYLAFSTGTFGFRNIEENTASFQSVMAVLDHLNTDIRNTFPYVSDDSKFKGNTTSISFITLVDSNSNSGMTRDFARVSYSLVEKDVLRLLKKNKYALNDKIDQPPVVIANNIKNIGFAYLYFDPDTNVLKEKDSWQGTDGFPVAVRITLTTLRNASKTYSRTVYLPIVKKNES